MGIKVGRETFFVWWSRASHIHCLLLVVLFLNTISTFDCFSNTMPTRRDLPAELAYSVSTMLKQREYIRVNFYSIEHRVSS